MTPRTPKLQLFTPNWPLMWQCINGSKQQCVMHQCTNVSMSQCTKVSMHQGFTAACTNMWCVGYVYRCSMSMPAACVLSCCFLLLRLQTLIMWHHCSFSSTGCTCCDVAHTCNASADWWQHCRTWPDLITFAHHKECLYVCFGCNVHSNYPLSVAPSPGSGYHTAHAM